MTKYFYTYIFLLVFSLVGFSQESELEQNLTWHPLISETVAEGNIHEYLYFDGAFTDMEMGLPLFTHSFSVSSQNIEIAAELLDDIYEPFGSKEQQYLTDIGFNHNEISVSTAITVSKKIPSGGISFIPIRLNAQSGVYEKLISFKLDYNIEHIFGQQKSVTRNYAENSILESGDWYKIKVQESGIYKISYSHLSSYGINPSNIDPRNIKIYGNGLGMLPEANIQFRHDDLQENSIQVVGEEDGVFDQSDYILFYGQSPHAWDLVLGFFIHKVNYYDDNNYYYITVGQEAGKRIELEPSLTLTPNQQVTKYTAYQVIEEEKTNLILSGKRWYGDEFGAINSRIYDFSFPNIDLSEDIFIKTEVANRSFFNEKMVIHVNGLQSDSINLTSVNPSSTKFAQKKKKTISFTPNSENISIELEYLPGSDASASWLDYIMVNAICNLNFESGQLSFRDLASVENGAISEFIIGNANQQIQVWDVTAPLNPKFIDTKLTDDLLKYVLATDSLREFIAFDNSHFLSPEFVGTVENQNLHGEGPFDMLIVSHPLFMESANQLKAIHEAKDGFSIKITTPAEIYNEFSSGKQDPTAIRDYLKMLYDKYEQEEPRFLLLFGDGSVDPKDRLENNTNFIPTFQTEESWISASSYVIDDYFGYLDDNEGNDGIGVLDIGIGRLPVKTSEEAQQIIDKIERYISTGEPNFGKWRTRTCMIADDEDGNLHMEQADSLSNYVGFIPKVYNQNKIYLDSYPQIKTPMGDRYPDVTQAINDQIEEGALIINYVGHGGKSGWAKERILQTSDILKWENQDNLPVFITATCEFSRFDEPELLTGGEMVLLNPIGGGIALFTTTRLAYSQANFALNQRLYERAFVKIDGEMPYLGDLIRYSKPPGQLTTRNFVLLGDPALRMAYPNLEIQTTEVLVNEEPTTDTIHALDRITMSGEIIDHEGNRDEDFNGFMIPTLYDNATKYTTIANDNNSYPMEYFCQDKIIWEGKATVTNGSFQFEFIVTKDIAARYGEGKFSFYAYSDETDAMGYYDGFNIGGFNENAESDYVGPEISLFLNDLSFESGDQTIASPTMLAFLHDIHGINTSGNGIGHSITMVLDDDYSNIINLNEYYKPDVDSYQEGKITFPFYDLPDGNHTLTLKAWDNYNNSNETTIEFLVNQNAALDIFQVYNYPNPFKSITTFTFNHTRPGDNLDLKLEIYDLAGRLVQRYENEVTTEITNLPFLTWNGDNLQGNRISNGVYIYTLQVTDSKGNVATKQQKLIITD